MSVIPTIEECANYPAWTQNVIMMVLLDGEPIGMATAYYINYRNKTVRLGMLIDKAFQGNGCGHSAMSQWIDRWFKNGFRKISVDNIDEHFTEPYLKVGFFVEGRFAKQCLVGGEYKDEIVMSCFLEDWKG
jgi:RimJ/RimL family protein N-acetyltransferase